MAPLPAASFLCICSFWSLYSGPEYKTQISAMMAVAVPQTASTDVRDFRSRQKTTKPGRINPMMRSMAAAKSSISKIEKVVMRIVV